MLSVAFWVALAGVFFGLKWLAEAWLGLPTPRRKPSRSTLVPIVSGDPSSLRETLREAA